MVDVSPKAETARTATARGRIVMAPETLALIREGRAGKGDVLGVARLAGPNQPDPGSVVGVLL